jgi:hypothetical protein
MFLAWHLFYLVLKNVINALTLFDRRFSKGLLLSIIGALIAFLFLLKPILFLFEKTIRFVFLIVNSATKGFSTDSRAMAITFAVILNIVAFVILHFFAKKSRNVVFKWFYELGFPGRNYST